MAYVLPNLDDEQQQQQDQSAPKLGGSQSFGGSSGGALGGGSMQQETPKAQNVTQRGTGFTNLQNWLDAGKGRDQNISKTGTGLLSTEKDTFNKAAKPLQDATYTANTFNGGAGTAVDKAIKTGDTKEIEGSLSNKYEGPRDINYDPSAQKNLWDTGALTDASTAGSVLARPAIEAGQYGAGMRRLDSVLYGADAASRAAMDATGKDLGAFTRSVGDTSQAMKDKVAGFDKAAADANAKNRAELAGVQGSISSGLDAAVARAQKKEAEARKAIADGYGIDENGKAFTLAPGETLGAISGGGATRENTANDYQRKGLNMLSKLLGEGEGVGTSDQPYRGVSAAAQKDPSYEGVDPWTGKDMHALKEAGYGTGEWMRKMSDFNNPEGIYQQALAQGLSKEQAAAVQALWQDSMSTQFSELAPSNVGGPSYATWRKSDDEKKKRDRMRSLLGGTKYANLVKD